MVYTFYSYKGGVGRSMALANVATLLAKWGARVLVVDFDLEAPGLEMYFERHCRMSRTRGETDGLVELLHARMRNETIDWSLNLIQAESGKITLDILCAGRKTDDYQQRVQQLDWVRLFESCDIGNYFDNLRVQWKQHYDFVLVDSRTGITDIGDVCTVLLPDALVVLFVSNYQNIDGVRDTVRRAIKIHSSLPVNRGRLIAVPIPARDEVYSEYAKSIEWKAIYAKALGDLYSEWLPKGIRPDDALNKLFIPYVTNWSFGESLPVLENPREIDNPASVSAAYGRIATLLQNHVDFSALTRTADHHELLAARSAERSANIAKADLENFAARTKRRSMVVAATSIAVAFISLGTSLIVPVSRAQNKPPVPVAVEPSASSAIPSVVELPKEPVNLGPEPSCDEGCCLGESCRAKSREMNTCPSGRECVPCAVGGIADGKWRVRLLIDSRRLKSGNLTVCANADGTSQCWTQEQLARRWRRSSDEPSFLSVTARQLSRFFVEIRRDGKVVASKDFRGFLVNERSLCGGYMGTLESVNGSELSSSVSVFLDDDTFVLLGESNEVSELVKKLKTFRFNSVAPLVVRTDRKSEPFQLVVGPVRTDVADYYRTQLLKQGFLADVVTSEHFVGEPLRL
jgi:cellulose biosynthesis protein BcsQ